MWLRRRCLVLSMVVLSLALTMVTTRSAWAWGRMGHRVAGQLAESRLTPVARRSVQELLEPGETLADASLWADEQKREIPESAPWHYVNVPITETGYNPRFCPDTGCVVSKIPEFQRTLADTTAGRAERARALRFLTHFVQDLHQPVHVGDNRDRGGNDLQLQYFGKGTNLHRIWDFEMLERGELKLSTLYGQVSALVTPERSEQWSSGSAIEWANESFVLAQKAYRAPGDGRLLRAGDKLGQAYEDTFLVVARERIARSGVRLAWLLNGTLK
ncbi:MAG: S1/P1 nuclease [Isosphaeraceae bacterium]|nr:S1/P1 nuclease [Isosphaeraceae bacterium]